MKRRLRDRTDRGASAVEFALVVPILLLLVFGIIDETVHLSARTRNPRIHAGDILMTAFDDMGSVGGHQAMAGGEIPLGLFGALEDRDDALVELVNEVLTERFFEETSCNP